MEGHVEQPISSSSSSSRRFKVSNEMALVDLRNFSFLFLVSQEFHGIIWANSRLNMKVVNETGGHEYHCSYSLPGRSPIDY